MKRVPRLAGIALAVVPILAVAACSSTSSSTSAAASSAAVNSAAPSSAVPQLSPGQKVSITFESYNLAIAGPWADTFKTLIAGFEKKYPNITVIAQKPSLGGTVTNAINSVYQESTAGNPPDVAQEVFGAMSFMVNDLKADNLDQVVGSSAVQANFGGAEPFASTAQTLGNLNGSTYGLPFVLSTPVLYYNASLFAKAGLNPATPPTTWAQVKTDALAIKARTGKDGAYIDCLTKNSGDWCWQGLVDSAGGSVLSSNGSRLTFAGTPAVQAATMAQGLVDSGAMPKLTQLQAYPAFAAGNMGMLLESSSLQSAFSKGAKAGGWTLADTTMPSFAGKPTEPTNSGAALFMFAKTPAKQRAAWDLMTYLTSPAAYTLISENIGYLPLRTGLVHDPNGLQAWAKANPLLQANLTQLARVQPWQSFPGTSFGTIVNDMMDAVQSVVFQNANPAATLSAAQQTASSLLPSGQ
jgi:multiple sugar transport system substrate-binding protein